MRARGDRSVAMSSLEKREARGPAEPARNRGPRARGGKDATKRRRSQLHTTCFQAAPRAASRLDGTSHMSRAGKHFGGFLGPPRAPRSGRPGSQRAKGVLTSDEITNQGTGALNNAGLGSKHDFPVMNMLMTCTPDMLSCVVSNFATTFHPNDTIHTAIKSFTDFPQFDCTAKWC